jgi:peptidoglycan hydrolase CwlO-like protein
MQEKRRNHRIILYVTSIILLASFVLPPFLSSNAENDVIEKIENQIEEKSGAIKNLENQAAEYQDKIKSLQIQEQSLQNEIELFDAQVSQLEVEIKALQLQIEEKNLEIERLMEEIKRKEEEIAKQKVVLKNLIRQIHDYDNETIFEILLKSEEISDFFNEAEYVDSFGEKIKEELDSFKSAKAELEQAKQEQQAAKEAFEKLSKEAQAKKDALSAEKAAKEELLAATEGSEYQYQNLLSNVRAQRKTILGDINNLMAQKQQEIARIAASANRPTQMASTTWYYSQNDPRWKSDFIGVSNSTINDYGCAITSVAMVFRYHGIDIDPKTLARQPIFVRDLISWPTKWRFLDLKLNSFHKSGGLTADDWKRIDQEIAAGNPVIIFIRALGRNAGHYVVIHSKDSRGYIVHDPVMWNGQSGANIYLDTTRKYLESIYQTNTVVDQMIIYN